MNKPFHEMTASERIAARIAQNRAIDERVAQRGGTPVRSLRDVKVSFSGSEAVGFSHSDTFPAIASVITTLCGTKNDFVGHREIVAALVKDSELAYLLDQIVARDPDERPRKWWANSMMAWFSQTTTERTNPYADMFERHPRARPYRYRVRQK